MEAIKARDWRSADGLTERDRALGELAEKLSTTPTRMREQDWERLRNLGFSDEDCLEVAHIVGIFNHLTRLADGLGLQLDEETSSASQSGIKLERVEA